MSRKSPPPKAPPPSQEVVASDRDDLPIHDFIGVCRVGKLYSVVAIKVQGDKVLEREVLTNPPTVKKPAAELAFRMESVRRGIIS